MRCRNSSVLARSSASVSFWISGSSALIASTFGISALMPRSVIVLDGAESDLIISVRTGSGRTVQPTMKGGPIDQRPGVAQGTDSTIVIGGQRGHPPLNNPNMDPMNQAPRMGNEIGLKDDSFT